MDFIGNWIAAADDFLWGYPLIILLLGTHLYFTFRLKFIQRFTFKGIQLSVQKDSGVKGSVSPMGALAVALASTIGTGNIVGVATAISLGGPGAVFWCWMTGVFGIATKYAESLLSVMYRTTDKDGKSHGGPMYAMARGFKNEKTGRFFAVLFCLFTLGSAVLGIGSMTQSNAVAEIVNQTFEIPAWCTGLFLAVVIGLVVLGGLKVIARVCTAIVPLMAAVYVAGCAVILCINHAYVWDAIVLIVKSAFSTQSAIGGFVGSSVMIAARYGVARGLFSNESGMGSAPIVAASAQTRNPVRQALISSTGTFWDTVIICAMTGIVIVSNELVHPEIPVTDKSLLTKDAFDQIPYIGRYILAFGIFSFASTTILGWFYYGEEALLFLTKKVSVMWAYKIVFVATIFIGTVCTLNAVWNFADLTNGLMVIPNVIALFALQSVILEQSKKYLWTKGGLEAMSPRFNKTM